MSELLLHGFELLDLDLDMLTLDQSQILREYELADFSLFTFHVNLDLALYLASFLKCLNLLSYTGLLIKCSHDSILALFNRIAGVLDLFNHSFNLEHTWYLAVHFEVIQICLEPRQADPFAIL